MSEEEPYRKRLKVSIDILDDEILSKIFFHLTYKEKFPLLRVCKQWKKICEQPPCILEKIDFSDEDFMLKNFGDDFFTQDKMKKLLLHCGSALKTLKFHRKYDTKILPVVKKYCKNLDTLKLNLKSYDEDVFLDAFTDMKDLKCIKIRNYRVRGKKLAASDTKLLSNLPESIEKISLSAPFEASRYPSLSRNFYKTLSKFNQLHSLTLTCWKINKNLMNAIGQLTTLIRLNLSHSALEDEPTSMISKLVNLEYLDFGAVHNVKDETIINVIENCKNMKHLNINECEDLTDKSLNRLGEIKNLEAILMNSTNSFYLYDMKDSIIDQFKNLKILECGNSCEITNECIMRILRNSPELQQLSVWETGVTLESINLAGKLSTERKKKLAMVVSYNVAGDFQRQGIVYPYLFVFDDDHVYTKNH